MAKTDDSGVVNIKLNQDHGLFSCSTKTGLRVFNVEPLAECAYFDLETMGSVSQCELLFRTNWIAVVSGEPKPMFPDNVLNVWCDILKKFVLEIIFDSSIKAVRLTKEKLVVALLNQVHVFSFPTPCNKLYTLETRNNPKGLCEISPLGSAEKQIVIFPGHKVGSVQILDLTSTEIGVSTAPVWIAAHQNELGCLALNQQGTRIATASVKGTLIRVWDTTSKNIVLELRRGTDPATIYCMNFSLNSEHLCCSSDKGTVHVFALKDTFLNRRMAPEYCSLPGALGNYADSQWALATFTVPQEGSCVCAFGTGSSVIAICLDGQFHKFIFSSDGSCNREAFDYYLDLCEDEMFSSSV